MLSNMQQGVSLPNRIVHNGTYVRNWHRTTCRRICSDGIGAQRFRSLHFITNTWSTPGRKSMWTVSVQVKILENVPQQALWAMQNHGAAGTTNLCSDAKLCTFGLANLSDSKRVCCLPQYHGACFLSNKNNLMPSLGLYGQAGDDLCPYIMSGSMLIPLCS